MMFGSSLYQVVCSRELVLFNLVVLVLLIVVSNRYCVVFLLCLSCVPSVANVSRLSVFD